jgi:hypothetical protein
MNPVAGTGIASVAHHIAIQMATPATRHAASGIVVWALARDSISAQIMGPATRPASW